MTGWGVGSLVHTNPTSQFSQTAEIVLDWKQAVSAGIFAGITPQLWSLQAPVDF
jgi:hypothetical protein